MARKAQNNFPSGGGHDGSHLRYAAAVEFSRKLRRLMAMKQLSQSDLARECWGEEETTQGYLAARGRDKINRYISGKQMPDPDSLMRMARALGVAEAELAPTVVGSALEREHPEIRMTMIAGHREHVHLTLDSVMPLECAVQIMAMFEKYQTRGATEAEREETVPLPTEVVEQAQQALGGGAGTRIKHGTRRQRADGVGYEFPRIGRRVAAG